MPDPLTGPLDTDRLLALDRQHVWHPYGPMPGRQEPLVVELSLIQPTARAS